MFKSVTHFEFIFVKSVRSAFRSIVLDVSDAFIQEKKAKQFPLLMLVLVNVPHSDVFKKDLEERNYSHSGLRSVSL